MIRIATLFATLSLFLIFAVILNGPASGNADANQAARHSKPADKVPPEFKQAGVCARCHVVSVLEWGFSGHLAAETNCQECHGPSRGHVANERNEVKPDRLPRGEAIAKQLCSTCHETGCPKTLQVQTCQKCHHVHALVNPDKPPQDRSDRLKKLLTRWDQFRGEMAKGEEHIQQQNWKAAQTALREALKLHPGNDRARTRLAMCRRRLDPTIPGFKIVSDRFDSEIGLPRDVKVKTFQIPMLLAPPGEFDMGSDELPDSRPRHTVRVDAFYLGRYEVTQAEWTAVMETNPSAHQGKGFANSERMPVERVSWNDCQEFIRRLNQRVPSGGFRLPTEAEWEYACRAGRQETRFSEKYRVSENAWFRANSLRQAQPQTKSTFLQVDAYAPRAVGTRRPNPWDFHDMQGNVSEWCSSLWRPYLYQATDGRESLTPQGMRVLRGGSFADSVAELDPALRHAERPHRRLRFNGLRLARSVPSWSPE